eukprot:7603033-Pyramimonas_sp.AAC.1
MQYALTKEGLSPIERLTADVFACYSDCDTQVHESVRFSSPMSYSLELSFGEDASVPCYGDCNGHGACDGHGMCVCAVSYTHLTLPTILLV